MTSRQFYLVLWNGFTHAAVRKVWSCLFCFLKEWHLPTNVPLWELEGWLQRVVGGALQDTLFSFYFCTTMANAYGIIFFFQLLSLTGASESGIVGGKDTKPHSKPYMASLQVRGHHTCGGILIREDFVLTVAHCENSEPVTVVLGAHDISKKEKSQQWIQVAKYHPHPKFITGKYDYDIMLLEVN